MEGFAQVPTHTKDSEIIIVLYMLYNKGELFWYLLFMVDNG